MRTSSEIWIIVVIMCFFINVVHSNRYQYGNSSVDRNDKKNREPIKKLQPIATSANQLQTSASSPELVNILQYLNKSNILNIGSISDKYGERNNRRSDVLTIAIPISELKSLQDGAVTTHELSLSDLKKLTESIQQYGIIIDGHNQEIIDPFQNPIHINLPDITYGRNQLIKHDVDQDIHYSKTNEEGNSDFRVHQQDYKNQDSEYNSNEHAKNIVVDHHTYLPRGTGISDLEHYNSYSKRHQQVITRQPTNIPRDESLQRNTRDQNSFKNDDAVYFDEYLTFPADENGKNKFSETNRPYDQTRNIQTNSNEHYSNTKDENVPEKYQQYSTAGKSRNNNNLENKETGSRLHHSNYNQNNFANHQDFSNRQPQSSVSYVLSEPSDSTPIENTVASQYIHQDNNAENKIPVEKNIDSFGANKILNRIGEASVDLPKHEVGEAQGNYKGDDGSGRFGSIPGIMGVDYPNYLSIPKTGFNCRQYSYPGYFADVEAQCQVYHICQDDGRHNSFLCPVGTLFNQKVLVCDWWYNTHCASSDSFFERNALLYEESIAANNYKGHNNLQHSSTRLGRNFRGTGHPDNYNEGIINQNINHFNGISERPRENLELANGRRITNIKTNDWEDITNDFSNERTLKYGHKENVAFSNNKNIAQEQFNGYKVDRIDQNTNFFDDVSETRVDNFDLVDGRRRNNQNNNWDDINNDNLRVPAVKHVSGRSFASSKDKYLPSKLKTDDKQIESLSSDEGSSDSDFDNKYDSWIRRDTVDNSKESSNPFGEHSFRPNEKRKYSDDKYDVSMPSTEDKVDGRIQKEILSSNDEVVNKLLDKPVTLLGNIIKSDSLPTEEKEKSSEQGKKPLAYESQHFGEIEEQSDDNNHNEFLHSETQTDTTLQGNEFKIENTASEIKNNVENDKSRYRGLSSLEEISVEESEEDLEEYDERPQIRGSLAKDTIHVEDNFASSESVHGKGEISLQIFNPTSTQVAPMNEKSVIIDDENVSTIEPLSNTEIQSNIEQENQQNPSDKNIRMVEERNIPSIQLAGIVNQGRNMEQEKKTYRNLETADTKPKSELKENKSNFKESTIAHEGDAQKDVGSTEEGSSVKNLSTENLGSKNLHDVGDILSELASGDRLYKNILISEVISPHYRNTNHNEQRSSSPMITDKNDKGIPKNYRLQNDNQFDNSENFPDMINSPRRLKGFEMNKDISDLKIDSAESNLHETISNPFDKTLVEGKKYGEKFKRINLRHAGSSSSKIPRTRYNDTARRKQLSRKIRHK